MASFETDLNRYLARYERDERAGEIDRAMMDENSDYAVHGESASLIPASDVLDAEVPTVRRYGWDDPGRVVVPGCYGM